MRYTQRMSAQPTKQIPVYRRVGESPAGHHVMPLWRRAKRGFPVFNGVEPNRLCEVFVNSSTEPNARDA